MKHVRPGGEKPSCFKMCLSKKKGGFIFEAGGVVRGGQKTTCGIQGKCNGGDCLSYVGTYPTPNWRGRRDIRVGSVSGGSNRVLKARVVAAFQAEQVKGGRKACGGKRPEKGERGGG